MSSVDKRAIDPTIVTTFIASGVIALVILGFSVSNRMSMKSLSIPSWDGLSGFPSIPKELVLSLFWIAVGVFVVIGLYLIFVVSEINAVLQKKY